jgi:23S rRNA (adenine2503-C2)-methyltransferase
MSAERATTPTDVVRDAEHGRYSVDRESLGRVLRGEPRYRVDQVWEGLYRLGGEPREWTALPAALRGVIELALPRELTGVAESISDDGSTVKFLWELEPTGRVETVLMLYPDRATVCVSSQAGCAMACGFCATGQAGFTRHLTVGEIVEQVAVTRDRARSMGRRLSNVVFMGMGEPLANERALWPAVERIHGEFGLSARHVTVSTVGLVPGIRRLAEHPLPVNLAVSLHAADDELRNTLVPINRRHPIDELVDACAEYVSRRRRRLSFEWAMIDGVNDRAVDAERLAGLCRRMRPAAHVNLIPLNPTPGYPTRGTPMARVREFHQRLVSLGVNATVRRNRGTDIDAACGQLAAGHPITISPRRRGDDR